MCTRWCHCLGEAVCHTAHALVLGLCLTVAQHTSVTVVDGRPDKAPVPACPVHIVGAMLVLN
jgi:hypothetical protein